MVKSSKISKVKASKVKASKVRVSKSKALAKASRNSGASVDISDDNSSIDELSGVSTTGHRWDGIEELDNPTPRWLMGIYYLTIIWSLIYALFYPSLPIDGLGGYFDYSSRDEVTRAVALHQESYADFREDIAAKSVGEIKLDEDLFRYAIRGGRSAFLLHCSQCHGTGGQGVGNYPNLNDDDWLWGGSIDDIEYTIRYGVRSEHGDTRFSQMPAFLDDGILDSSEISDVADHVLSLSGLAGINRRGARIFSDNCASCHGFRGEGDSSQGASNLRDAIWLYGGDRVSVLDSIRHSRNGVMPHWVGRLDSVIIKQLSLYIHSLGGGESDEN